MYANGFKNTIALMGTSLTKEQIDLIFKLHVPVILMLDNDDAGALATMSNGRLLLDAGIDVEVIRLSGKKDPDEYILAYGKEAMQNLLEHPESFMEFQYEHLKENKDLRDTENLASYVRSVLDTLKKADPITIDITLNKLASEYHLSYDVLKQELKLDSSPPVVMQEKPKKEKKSRYKQSVEHLLYYMMNDIKYIKIYQTKLGYFEEENYRKVASEIIYYADEHKKINVADFLSYAELSPLKAEIYEIIKSIKEPDIEDTSINDYINNIKEIMWENELKKMKVEQRKMQDINEKERIGLKIVELMKNIQELKKERSVKE